VEPRDPFHATVESAFSLSQGTLGSKHELNAAKLQARIESKQALIGVVGLGYVGLPLCVAFGEAGAKVLGFDIDPNKTAAINDGQSYLKQYSSERISALVQLSRFSATHDMDRLSEADVILICVPTPLTKNFAPDLSFVEETTATITKALRKGQLVVLESSTYPGTTREVVQPILEKSGLIAGEDFWLAYSPEREDPGNDKFTTAEIPKVLGADDEASRNLAAATYAVFAKHTVPVSSSAAAEAVKITENIFRAVNIALVNELKIVYSRMGIDIWEVIDAAKTKPFGFMPFYPGPGLGGHCIPVDPFYLTWKAREFGLATRFIELAGQINTSMPHHVVSELQSALDSRHGKGLNGAKILLLGIAYKKNVDDLRESPALKIIQLLEGRGANVAFHDPHVPVIPVTREHGRLAGRTSVALDARSLASFEAVLIATDHEAVDYGLVAKHSKLIIDTRNVCARAGVEMSRVVRA
jgi:UDP-N-acetyl-D-glucosamine dehydrogenase